MATKQTKINGNGKPYEISVPKLVLWTTLNEVAIANIELQTGLKFVEANNGCMIAQPADFSQIGFLLTTYNFKTRYYNNLSFKNEIHLKSDHHIGYVLDSVCKSCLIQNHIPAPGLKDGERMAC